MKMIRSLSLPVILIVYLQDVMTINYPIGPSFISTITTKQKLYYNNLGIRLDCLAIGIPSPVLTWFRLNGNDDRSLISVQSSELIDVYKNGSIFIRPFREYFKPIHAGSFICRAENPAGSIQTIPIQLKPQIYDTYEIEVKNPYGFEQSSVILSCELSPSSVSSFVNVVGWLEKVNNRITQLDLKIKTKYNFLTNKNLIIHNLTKSDDNKSYACIVYNRIDNDTKQSRFKLLRVRDRSPFGPELSVPNNTEYRAQAGDVIELPCGIASLSTNAQISWWKDGIKINNIVEKIYNNSLVLKISSSSANDSGIYACRIDDESIGQITSVLSLQVNLPIQCQMNIQQTNINAGSTSELTCQLKPIKSTSIHWQWYHNSIPLSTKLDRYLITNATRKHMGMYQCCYTSPSSDINNCCAQTQIRIINSPPFILTNEPIHSNNIIVSPSTTSHIDLSCTIYGDPIPEINILKNGEKLLLNNPLKYLPSGDIFVHYSIYISNITDTGLYECHAKNSFGSISFSKNINIEKQKPFIQPLTNLTIRTDEEFTLICYASGQPNLYLQWIDEINKQIINTSSTSPILFTSRNTKSNIYTCKAINPYGEISSQLYLNLQIPANIVSITPDKTVKINEKLEIYCFIESDEEFELTFKSKKLNIIKTNQNFSVIIDNIQMSDSGIYECSVKNNYSQDRKIFEIIVQNIPDKIEKIFMKNSERIFWMKPFDGNSDIFKYILRIKYKQGLSWSNETIIIINNNNITSYSFENIFSKCTISVTIQAVNLIGSSLPSDPIQFQTNIKQLQIAPYNLTAINISSRSVMLIWQYPSFEICPDSFIEFVIEITDQYNETIVQTHSYHSTVININQLKSFTYYTFVIYAVNELGRSMRSQGLKIRTLDNVPFAVIEDLASTLLNSSTAYITWTFKSSDFRFLNGKFRTFAVTIYENFNMSTITTIETTNTNLILSNLHSSSLYYISVAICNYLDCGSSSAAIDIRTPSSIFDRSTTILHPINKPLILDCPLLPNNSLYIAQPKPGTQYRCGPKLFNIQYYDKPSSIRAKVHYTKSNEIGLKILYPSEIIESLTITYKIQDNPNINELNIFPPLLNVRLTNLSCGNIYEIMIYANNQVGFSLMEYLIVKTDGSIPSMIGSNDLLETISNNYIIVNMANWIIDECPILSYEIEIFPIINSNLKRSYSFRNQFTEIKIDNLQIDEDYQLNIKINSQAGENIERVIFRTMNNKMNNQQIFIIICIGSFLIIFVLVIIIIKFCRQYLKRSDAFIGQTRKLKPILYSNKIHRNIPPSDFLSQNRSNSFESEDSQGNINPYAVTGYSIHYKNETDHGPFCDMATTEIHPSERYFRPIILESSISNNQDLLKRNPLIQVHEKPLLSNIISSSSNELFSAFTYISSPKVPTKKSSHNDQSSTSADSGVHSTYTQSPRCPLHNISFNRSLITNQTNPLYDEIVFPKPEQYSLV